MPGPAREPSPSDWIERPAEEVYAQLQAGDPLDLERLCREHLKDAALLLDVSTLLEESRREIAFECEIASLEDTPTDWRERAIARSAERMLQDYRGGAGSSDPVEHHALIELFQLTADEGTRACVQYHSLPQRVRRAFQALVLEDQSLEQAEADGHGTTDELLRIVFQVLDTVGARIDANQLGLNLGGEG